MTASLRVTRCVLTSRRLHRHLGWSRRVRHAPLPRETTSRPVKAKPSRNEDAADDLVSVWGGLEIPKPLLTTYIPVVLVVAILAYLDAAFSGDWVRIGVLSSSQEQFLRDFCIVGVAIHALLGVAAAKVSRDRGERTWALRGLKTFVVGIVSFTEVIHLPEDA